MRVVFFGSSYEAKVHLRCLLGLRGVEVAAVYTRAPKPAGRGMGAAGRRTPVHIEAEARGLCVRCPASLKKRTPETHSSTLGVVVAYGLLLPAAWIDAFDLGIVNVHMSLLPRWRGAAPAARAIMAQDKETGVSLMQLTPALDSGPVFAAQSEPITPEDTAASLSERLCQHGVALLASFIAGVREEGRLPYACAQDESMACYARKITAADRIMCWKEDAEALAARICGLSPAPAAWFLLPHRRQQHMRVKALFARPVAIESQGAPGEIMRCDDQFVVACKTGALRLEHLQKAGGAPMGAADFLRGARLLRGQILPDATQHVLI